MRGIVAKRIHKLMKEGGPALTWHKARALWFTLPGFTVGATTPKLDEPRKRKSTFKGLRNSHYEYQPKWHAMGHGHRDCQPHYGPPIIVRHMHVLRPIKCSTTRPNAGRGRQYKARIEAMGAQLKIAMERAATRASIVRKQPKVYPSASVRARTRNQMRRGK